MKWEAITAIGTIVLIGIGAITIRKWLLSGISAIKRRVVFVWRRERHISPLFQYEGILGPNARFNRKVWNDCHNRDSTFNEKTKRTMGEITRIETQRGMKEIE